jgi:ubiquinone/menaquinone biosynthesis C-methylase UbiE
MLDPTEIVGDLETRVEHAEMVALIRSGVDREGAVWADLGAGTGNFTRALAALLGPQATIYAVDRSASALARVRESSSTTTLLPIVGDFTRSLDLPMLDGILMANALHFVRDQAPVLTALAGYLRPGGRFLLVEYEMKSAVRWVPFPVPFEQFQSLAMGAGLGTPALIGRRRSPSTGVEMYAAALTRGVVRR